MDLKKITEDFFKEVERGRWRRAETYLDDKFEFYSSKKEDDTALSYRLDKKAWLDFQKAIQEAFSDWSFHISKIEERGVHVYITVHIRGTHTGELLLPHPGLATIPATGIKISLPAEKAELTFNKDKILKMHVDDVLGGGLEGIIEQLKST